MTTANIATFAHEFPALSNVSLLEETSFGFDELTARIAHLVYKGWNTISEDEGREFEALSTLFTAVNQRLDLNAACSTSYLVTKTDAPEWNGQTLVEVLESCEAREILEHACIDFDEDTDVDVLAQMVAQIDTDTLGSIAQAMLDEQYIEVPFEGGAFHFLG